MTPLNYLDFDLAIETLDATANRHRVRVLNSPAGQATGEFTLPFDERDLELLFLRLGRPRRSVRRIGSPEMAAAQQFGSTLYQTVFTDGVQNCLQRSLDAARSQGRGVRLRLRLSDAPVLTDLPWEFLFDTNHSHFLAYSTATPIVRYLDLPQGMGPLAVEPPLKILVMIANPRDYGYEPLDVEAEWQKVHSALAELEAQGLVEVTRLEAATLSALQRQLRRDSYHIFHFVGHGGFDEQTQSGALLLEDEDGRSRMVSGHYLGALVRDHFSLRLALLNACEGARTSRVDPFAGVAQHLVQQGIPAVIAMQFEITDPAAITLAHEFYGAVADGYPVDAALCEARKAIYAAGNDIEWGTPVLYMRAVDGDLFDVAALTEARKDAKAQRDAATVEAQTPAAAVAPIVASEIVDTPEQPVAKGEVAEPRQFAGEFTSSEVAQTLEKSEFTGPVARDQERIAHEKAESARNRKRIFEDDESSSQPTPQVVKPEKRRWWRVVVAGVALIAVIYLSAIGINNYQTTQRQNATRTAVARTATAMAHVQATRQAEVQPAATALAEQASAAMIAKIPAAQSLVDEYGMYFVEIPGGEFTMGSTDAEIDAAFALCEQYDASCSRDWFTDEAPQQILNLDAFWIMQTEVTNGQFAAFVDDSGYTQEQWWSEAGWAWRGENDITQPRYWDDTDWNQPDHPVVGISWYEATAYAAWLADKTELEIRLPTEAEWEKAARGTEGRIFPWGNEWDGTLLNYCDESCTYDWKDETVNDGYVTTAPVGSYPGGVSPYGALDMAGNVWEWTSSQDVAYPYDTSDGREEPEGDARRVLRGGSWLNQPNLVRAAYRYRNNPDFRFDTLGVRLVLAVAPR